MLRLTQTRSYSDPLIVRLTRTGCNAQGPKEVPQAQTIFWARGVFWGALRVGVRAVHVGRLSLARLVLGIARLGVSLARERSSLKLVSCPRAR